MRRDGLCTIKWSMGKQEERGKHMGKAQWAVSPGVHREVFTGIKLWRESLTSMSATSPKSPIKPTHYPEVGRAVARRVWVQG
jgi:hypothetical protein